MKIMVAMFWFSISLFLISDNLLASTSGISFRIDTPFCVVSILLQLTNVLLCWMFGIVLFDFDWLFLLFVDLFYQHRSNLPMNKPQKEIFNYSVASTTVSTSLVSSVPTLSIPITGPSFEVMMASTIRGQSASLAVISSKPDSISGLDSSDHPSPPYQRRSLWPCLAYSCGITAGSPREIWYVAKERRPRDTSEEVGRSPHVPEGNAETQLRRLSYSINSSHPPFRDMSLNEFSISMTASMTSQESLEDYGGGVSETFEESALESEALETSDENIPSDESICTSYDNTSRGTVETSELVDEASPNAMVEEFEQSWIDIPPLFDGTLSTASPSMRDFMVGLDDAHGKLN